MGSENTYQVALRPSAYYLDATCILAMVSPSLGHIDFKSKAMYFSWENVQHGYAVVDDAVNVAIHEMAHLLEAEQAGQLLTQQSFDDFSWHQWATVAVEKINIMRSGQGRFIKH